MKVKEIRKVIPILTIVIVIAGLSAYWLYRENIDSNGRLYPSKSEMCEEFAKSYLRTTKKLNNINDFSGGNTDWSKAIAIESEINNLCQLELTDEDLENYSTNNIKKYLDDYRHN